MARKVYIYPADGYLGQRLGSALKERGYEVVGGYAKAEAPAFLSASYQIGSHTAPTTSRQFLAKADVVIYELHGHEQAARDAVVHMAKQPFGGRQQLYIGVSTPLVWAAARPAPPEEEVDVPDSASVLAATVGGGLRGTSEHASVVGTRGFSRAVSVVSTANATASGVADAYAIAAAAGALTDRAAARRAPCLSARDVYELEQLIVRCQRKGKLRTSVVCPGLLYGCGESVLHGIMQQAWQLSEPLKMYGNGSNHLPMMHVDDCAAYLAALCGAPEQGGDALMAGLPETLQYLVAADCPAPGMPGGALQSQLIQELAKRLGNGQTSTVASEQLLFTPNVEQWTLNTPLVCTPLPAGAPYQPQYSQGVLHHIDDVIQQWRDVRGVNPLRITVFGPPMAGKSTIAARLAALYKLPLITARDLLAATDKLTPEEAKALSQEMNGKEGRASGRSMAALLRAVVLGNKTAVNRGYILDAYPKTSGQAKWAFMKLAPLSAEEVADKDKEESSRVSTPATGKGAAGKPAPAKKETKKETKTGAGAADNGPDVPSGFKLVADRSLAPTHLIQVNASQVELAARRAEVERQELATARSATPSEAPKAGKGGKDKGGSTSHNNEKDFARRMAVWTQICADEAADLEAQVAAAKAQWAKQQAEQAAERERMEAEARTLRARRRRAREEAAQMAAAGAQAVTQTLPGSATTTALQSQQLNTIDSTQGTENDSTEQVTTQLPPQEPTLPQYGGLAGVLCSSCSTQVLKLENPDVNDSTPITAASWDIRPEQETNVNTDDGSTATLEGLEQQLKGFLGPARNFEGFPQHTRQTISGVAGGFLGAMNTDTQKSQLQQQEQQQQAQQQEEAEQQQQAHEAARQAALSLAAKHGDIAEPVRRFIMAEVMPTVTDALRLICTDRKSDPLRFLAHHLLKAADEWESSYVDPYTDPRYEQQRVKLREKQARDAARELAAQQKAERELAAKQAAKLAEQEAEALAAAAALQEQEARLAREAISKQESMTSCS